MPPLDRGAHLTDTKPERSAFRKALDSDNTNDTLVGGKIRST